MPRDDPGRGDLGRLRIAFHADNGLAAPTPETSAVVRKAALLLADAGMRVDDVRPTAIEQTYDLVAGLFGADGGAALRRLLQIAGTAQVHPLTQRLAGILEPYAVSTAELDGVLTRLDVFRSSVLAFLESYDVVISPVHPKPALPHGTSWDDDYRLGFAHRMVHNLTGWPAAVVRGGTSPEGLPIGVQVAAGPWREDVALALARQIEVALAGWPPRRSRSDGRRRTPCRAPNRPARPAGPRIER